MNKNKAIKVDTENFLNKTMDAKVTITKTLGEWREIAEHLNRFSKILMKMQDDLKKRPEVMADIDAKEGVNGISDIIVQLIKDEQKLFDDVRENAQDAIGALLKDLKNEHKTTK